VTYLEHINGPAGPQGALPRSSSPSWPARSVMSWSRRWTRTSGPPRPQPRRGRADDRAAPGVRLAQGQADLRHRPPVLRAQAADRPAPRIPHALRQAGGPVGLPEPGRVRARPGGEQPRRPTSLFLRRRHGQGLPAAGASTTARSVAVIGDGRADRRHGPGRRSTTSPVARDSRLVIVVNDNGRSYQPTIGGLASPPCPRSGSASATSRCSTLIKTTVTSAPVVGNPLFGALHGAKKGLKDFLQPQVLFEDLGLKYIGPIDGHDEQIMEQGAAPGGRVRQAGAGARDHPQGVRLRGWPSRTRRTACTRSRPPRRSWSPRPRPAVPKRSWTDVFAEEMGRDRAPAVRTWVAITAAMLHPVGPGPVPGGLPGPGLRRGHRRAARDDDGGRAGDGGPAPGDLGLRDVPETGRSTRLLMDVALHSLPVTVTLGPGGRHRRRRRQPQRQCWGDGSILQVVPGLRVAAPARRAGRVAELLNEAVEVGDGPHRGPLPQGQRRPARGRGGRQARPDGRAGRPRPRQVPATMARTCLLLGAGPDGRHRRRCRPAG